MKTTLVAAGTLAVLVACGGGSTGSMSSMSQAGMQSVVTMGTITAFGSVFVNGVRYDVSRATLKKNDTTVAQTGLAVGEVALVRGREDTQTGQGEADSVDVEDSVVGPAMITGSQLTVLDQTISITANTSFGPGITPADLTGLKMGDSIEVSGLPGMGGVIMATRIGRAESNEPLQVLGTVGTVSATTFPINGLTVDFSKANVSGFASGKPETGKLVIARGTAFDGVTLIATAVRLADTDRDEQAAGGLVEEEGLITSAPTPDPSGMGLDFVVAGAQVMTTGRTVFKGGVATDLAVNVRVEVRGTLNANKMLVADVVEIEHIAVIALLGTADVTMGLTVLGVPIKVDANTRFEDESSAQLQMFALKDVMMNDTVLVRGYESPAGSGMVLATRLVRLPPLPSMDVGVRGPFTPSTTTPATQFTILSITIDATSAKLFGKGGQSLTTADFFTQAVGQVVDVLGTATGSTVTASKAIIDPVEDH
jgi:hypothetical protein